MASEALNKYIEKRYDRWLDYAKYHCSLAGMSSEAIERGNVYATSKASGTPLPAYGSQAR